jgi:hypothetical protein
MNMRGGQFVLEQRYKDSTLKAEMMSNMNIFKRRFSKEDNLKDLNLQNQQWRHGSEETRRKWIKGLETSQQFSTRDVNKPMRMLSPAMIQIRHFRHYSSEGLSKVDFQAATNTRV